MKDISRFKGPDVHSNGLGMTASDAVKVHPRFVSRIQEVRKSRLEELSWNMASIYCLLRKAAKEIGANEGLIESLRTNSLTHQSEEACDLAKGLICDDEIGSAKLSDLKDRCLCLQDHITAKQNNSLHAPERDRGRSGALSPR